MKRLIGFDTLSSAYVAKNPDLVYNTTKLNKPVKIGGMGGSVPS